MYNIATDNLCRYCDTNCLTCTLSNTHCSTCAVGKFLYNNACTTQCPTKFYGDSSDNTCKGCHANCATCSAAL